MRELVAAAVLLAAPSVAFAQTQPGAPTILRLTAEAEARLEPDRALITAGVVSEAPTAVAALNANARMMNEVIRTLKRADVKERDLQTENVSVFPQYAYAEGEPPRLTGHRAQNSVRVTVRELKQLGKVIDAVAASGASEIGGVVFEASDPEPALKEARIKAVQEARARAELYAQALGMQVVRVALVEEGTVPQNGPPSPIVALRAAQEASTPVEPGELTYSAAVVATFELR